MKQMNFSTNALTLGTVNIRSTQPANSIKIVTKTTEIFMMKVEIVYLLAGLLWLIFLVDLTFSMISLILRSNHNGVQRILKNLPTLMAQCQVNNTWILVLTTPVNTSFKANKHWKSQLRYWNAKLKNFSLWESLRLHWMLHVRKAIPVMVTERNVHLVDSKLWSYIMASKYSISTK